MIRAVYEQTLVHDIIANESVHDHVGVHPTPSINQIKMSLFPLNHSTTNQNVFLSLEPWHNQSKCLSFP